MMNYYLNVRLRPNPEINANVILNAFYNKLHGALVEMKTNQIGVTFPEYQCRKKAKIPTLGNLVRLHSDADSLNRLINSNALYRLKDHIIISDVLPVPTHTGQCIVRRKQIKSNPERSRRRLMARHGIDQYQALQKIPDNTAKRTDLPYLILVSQSTGQKFRLFIDQRETSEQKTGEPFNAYGISRESTLPLF